MLALIDHNFFMCLLFAHCLVPLSCQILASLHVPSPQTEALSKGFGFLFVIARLSTRGLFTSRPTHILPNSHLSQPFRLPQGRWERSAEAPGEPSYCLGELEATRLRASILPPPRTPCFLSIILEHQVLGRQFCPQDVCLQALPSKSQSSRLPLTIQTLK